MDVPGPARGSVAFALIYLTFFLDNVLLTVLVPIIPDWVRGESLALWAGRDAPLAAALNATLSRAVGDHDQGDGVGGSQAVVGAVLGAKATAQLAAAPLAGAAVQRRGAAAVLRAGTAALALAASVFAWCGGTERAAAAWCAGAGRAAHGLGAALCGVGGLALAARALPPARRPRALGALLGAVALGVLVGYPFGGAADLLGSRAAPFALLGAALLADLALQYAFLDGVEFDRACPGAGLSRTPRQRWARAARRPAGACAGAVLLTTCVMAALEPCLPLWIEHKFHPQVGAVFVPDSLGYLAAATLAGGGARAAGAERVALAGQACAALGALGVPHARSLRGLWAPHALLGAGLGATDAALVPALLARRPRRVPQLAALLQAASSAAYALGPVAGGLLSWGVGFETALRTLGVLNLLYAVFLYRALAAAPLSQQWGAAVPGAGGEGDSDSSDTDDEGEAEGEVSAPARRAAPGAIPGDSVRRGAGQPPRRPPSGVPV